MKALAVIATLIPVLLFFLLVYSVGGLVMVGAVIVAFGCIIAFTWGISHLLS